MNEFEESNKKHLKEMTTAQKLQYFKDYYLLWTVLITAGAAFVIYGLYTFFKPQPVHVLTVTVFDDVEEEEALDQLEEEVRDVLDAHDSLDEVRFQTNYMSTNSTDLTRLSVMAAANELDVIVAPREIFEQLAAGGLFRPLGEVLDASRMEQLEGLIVEAAGFETSEDLDVDTEEAGAGEVLPYGISLADCDKWQNCMTKGGDVVLGFVASTNAVDNAVAFTDLLFES